MAGPGWQRRLLTVFNLLSATNCGALIIPP
jgi:hypothetical protein